METIIISTDTLIVFDQNKRKQTFIKGKDTNGIIMIASTKDTAELVHTCMNAKECNHIVEISNNKGEKLLFNKPKDLTKLN